MNRITAYQYDADGLLISKKRHDGSVIQYSFDESKQLTRIGAPDAETKFNYDINGNLNWIWNKHSSINRGHYPNGQMKIENQRGYNLAYSYTAVGQRATMTANGNQTNYYYNGMDIVNQIQAQINGQNYVWTRQLDNLNRPTKDVLPNGIEVHRAFTDLSQLASINNYNPNENLISGFAYGYDDVGKRISKVENNFGTLPSGKPGVKSITNTYSYDDLDRLTQATSPAESFSYDAVGNRQYASGTSYNVINQLLGDGWKYTFEYNLNGDMTKKTNTQTGQETNFIWNTMSQLMAMQVKDSGNVTKEIFFKYDGLGRRIERQVVDYVDSSKSYGRRFYYDGDMIIEEQDQNGNVLARYMNGPGIDDPLLVARSEGAFVFTKDGLGSITEVTKSNAAPIQKYRYSAYGVTTQELQENLPDKKLIENRYAYTGRELEDEKGLYYYRARYYDPELGRFISEDPIGLEGMDPNMYGYVGNSPINRIDPNGEDWIDVAEGSMEFLVAIGDSASFGLTSMYRDSQGYGNSVNMCSPLYKAGEYTAIAASFARLAYAGTVKAGAMLAKDAKAASAFRNNMKRFFRGGDPSKTKSYSQLAAKYKDQVIKQKAGTTNKWYNSWFAGMGASAAGGGCKCQ